MNRTYVAFALCPFLLAGLLGFHLGHESPAGDEQLSGEYAPDGKPAEPVILGPDRWSVVPGWGQNPDMTIGNTHGGVMVDHEGRVLYNTDTERSILIHDAEGAFIGSLAGRFPGIHGMQLRIEDEVPYIYAAHLAGKQVLKLRLLLQSAWLN